MKKNIFNSFAIIVMFVSLLSISGAAFAQSYNLYGITTAGGRYNEGTIYKYSYPSGAFSVIHSFNDTDGAHPSAYLMQANDGKIYSTTRYGGTYNLGVFYSLDPTTNTQTVLENFNGANGANPEAGMMQAQNGLLYASTSAGGVYNYGALYSYDINTHTQTVLFSFSDTNGNQPSAHVVQAINGLIYGHTMRGGTFNDGILFSYNINTNIETTLLTFNGTNGALPRGLTEASNGLLYGCAYKGGPFNDGLLYSFDPTNETQSIVINYSGANGMDAGGVDAGDPFEAANGLLYSTAVQGGIYGNGTLYSYNTNTNAQNIFLNFSSSGMEGRNPNGCGYAQTSDGLLYIPIDSGGANGYGCILSINPTTDTYQDIHDFTLLDGVYPLTNLLCIKNDCPTINNTRNILAGNVLIYTTATGIYNVSIENMHVNCTLIIYDMLGKEIYQKALVNSDTRINITNQSKGIYLYKVIDLNGTLVSSGKIIMQ